MKPDGMNGLVTIMEMASQSQKHLQKLGLETAAVTEAEEETSAEKALRLAEEQYFDTFLNQLECHIAP